MKRLELTGDVPYGFPFAAMLRGQENDHKRLDQPCIVLGRVSMERHYFRVNVAGRILVANDSMLYVEE